MMGLGLMLRLGLLWSLLICGGEEERRLKLVAKPCIELEPELDPNPVLSIRNWARNKLAGSMSGPNLDPSFVKWIRVKRQYGLDWTRPACIPTGWVYEWECVSSNLQCRGKKKTQPSLLFYWSTVYPINELSWSSSSTSIPSRELVDYQYCHFQSFWESLRYPKFRDFGDLVLY